MKLKYYLRGLGIGIIVTTVVLTISNNIRVKELKKSLEEVSVTEATKETLFAVTEAATEPQTESGTEPQTEPETEPETEVVTEPETQKVITYTLKIERGMYSEKVAGILYENGIVDDKKSFNKYLADNKYSSKISTGEFVLTSDMTYEQIAKKITVK